MDSPLSYHPKLATASSGCHESAISLSEKGFKSRPLTRKVRHYLLGLSFRIVTLVVIIAVLAALGLGLLYTDGLPNSEDFSQLTFDWKTDPGSYLKPYNSSFQYNVLMDGHSHTVYSDGKMTPRQLLDWHIANGYNAVIVSEHNSIQGGQETEKLALAEYKDRIVVIPAMEYSSCRIHMNLININQTLPSSAVPTDQELQSVIQQVHALGGLVIVNHIPWSNTTQSNYQVARLPNHPSISDLIAWGVDGFEVINQDVFDYTAYMATQQYNLIGMTGMDVHHPSVGANTWLTVNASSFDKDAILNEIRNRRTSFLFDPTGTRPRIYPGTPANYNTLAPLTGLGGYFSMFYSDDKGMYSFQASFCQPEVLNVHRDVIGWFIFWVILCVLVYEGMRALVLSLAHFIGRRHLVNKKAQTV